VIRSLTTAPGRRVVLVVALFGLLATVLITVRASQASAYTIENTDENTITITSARLHDKTIRATVFVELHRDGNFDWWVDAHNTGHISKDFEIKWTVKFATIYTSISEKSTFDIDSTDYATLRPFRPSIYPYSEVREHWSDLRAGFQAEFHLVSTNIF
jgi:hypothetical protein